MIQGFIITTIPSQVIVLIIKELITNTGAEVMEESPTPYLGQVYSVMTRSNRKVLLTSMTTHEMQSFVKDISDIIEQLASEVTTCQVTVESIILVILLCMTTDMGRIP